MKLCYAALGIVASALLAQLTWSADSLAQGDSLAQRIESCAQHQDDAARLRCFDATARALHTERAVAHATSGRAPVSALTEHANTGALAGAATAERAVAHATSDRAPVSALTEHANTGALAGAATAERAATASAIVGRSAAERARATQLVAGLENPASKQPVTARVISISKTPTLQRRIELDNGQVWQENEHDKSLLLAAGDSVQIQSGALRSFVLRAPSGGSTHVRRVR